MAVVRLTEAENETSVAVRLDEIIELGLPENPSTGFRWKVVRADGLTEEPEAPSAGGRPAPEAPSQIGRGGIRLFRFRAVSGGSGRLELKLWREFEGDSSILKRFALDVRVTT